MLAVDATVSPAVFRPGDRLLDSYHSELTCGSDLATIAQALSLLADSHVALGPQWDDHGDLAPLVTDHAVLGTPDALRPVSGPTVIQDAGTTIFPNDHEVHTLDEPQISSLLSLLSGANHGIRTGLARWCSSKAQTGHLTARFIDLRIALEALFVDSKVTQGSRFSIAVLGAWLLGIDGPGRRRIWRILRDAYKTASDAVHTGEVDRTDENLQVLSDAQALCREALFEFLHNGPVEDWPDVFLGVATRPSRDEPHGI